MKTIFLLMLSLQLTAKTHAQPAEKQIRVLLANQVNGWNRGNIPAFMNGYWKSDSLMFVGKSGITYGWQKILDNYQKNYPNAATMGQLNFDIVQLKLLSTGCYFVLGKWFIKRTAGDVNGHFTLILQKFKDGWKIVSDHSS